MDSARPFTPTPGDDLDPSLPPSSGTRSGGNRQRSVRAPSTANIEQARPLSPQTPTARPQKKQKTVVPSSRDYVFKCRHFNAAWLKKNPNARASVVNKVIVTTCRMPPECTAIDLYDRLKLLFQRHLTFPDEVEREEADGTPGGLWEVQYAIGAVPKNWTSMNLADEVEHRDMLQDGNKTRTIWLNLHEFKGVSEDADDEDEAEDAVVRRSGKRKEGNPVNITEKVNEFSIELQKLHACTKHGSPWCWRSQPDDRHVPLNMAQIRSWANAMATTDNPHADMNRPPNTREFDIGRTRTAPSSRVTGTPSPAPSQFSESISSVSPSIMLASSHFSTLPSSSGLASSPQSYLPPPTAFSLAQADDDAILHKPGKGPKMSLEEFCSSYELPESVRIALQAEEIDGPDILSGLPFRSYRLPSDQDGLGLKMGAAFRLKEAMLAWKQGFTSRANWEAQESSSR